MMRAAVIRQHGPPGSIAIEHREIPVPSENQVLVRVRACGLNHLDVWVRRGVPGHRFPLPIVPGSDITGVVERVGAGVSNVAHGARVLVDPAVNCGVCERCAAGEENLCSKWGLLGESADGGCREYLAVDARQIHALPGRLTFEQGACIPIAYVTAWHMLVEKARIRTGETILIHAAGSGVSVACLQIAKMHGLQIYVTSTSDEKLQRAKTLGAHRFFNTSKEAFCESVRNHTGKRGVDVVVDHVGEPTFMESVRSLRRGGRLVSCGATAGSNIALDWKHVFFKNLTLYGVTGGTKRDFATVLDAFARGDLFPVLDSTVPLDELGRAHAALESRKAFGKIVVSFGSY